MSLQYPSPSSIRNDRLRRRRSNAASTVAVEVELLESRTLLSGVDVGAVVAGAVQQAYNGEYGLETIEERTQRIIETVQSKTDAVRNLLGEVEGPALSHVGPVLDKVDQVIAEQLNSVAEKLKERLESIQSKLGGIHQWEQSNSYASQTSSSSSFQTWQKIDPFVRVDDLFEALEAHTDKLPDFIGERLQHGINKATTVLDGLLGNDGYTVNGDHSLSDVLDLAKEISQQRTDIDLRIEELLGTIAEKTDADETVQEVLDKVEQKIRDHKEAICSEIDGELGELAASIVQSLLCNAYVPEAT